MKIGILGGGNVGGALGVSWTAKGHQVFYGVRNPESPEMAEILAKSGDNARAGSVAEAAAFGEVVVNALPWPATKDVLASLPMAGKILLDCSNPLLPGLSGLEVGTTSSGGELVAQWAKGAKVAKVFNTTGFGNMENPAYRGTAIPMFYCSDDADARSVAATLAGDTGFEPVDAGPLANSRLLEPYALLWIWLAVKRRIRQGFRVHAVAPLSAARRLKVTRSFHASPAPYNAHRRHSYLKPCCPQDAANRALSRQNADSEVWPAMCFR